MAGTNATAQKLDLILLGMSTLNRLSSSSFKAPRGRNHKNIDGCISAQECVVRYWLKNVIPCDQNVRIIALCTKETLESIGKISGTESLAKEINDHWGREIVKVVSENNPAENKTPNQNTAKEEAVTSHQSTRNFNTRNNLKMRFGKNNFIRIQSKTGINLGNPNAIEQESKDNEISVDKPKSNPKDDNQCQKTPIFNMEISAYDFFCGQIERCEEQNNVKRKIDFNVIEISQSNIPASIRKVTEELRGIYEDKEIFINHLYVDTHGGFREISQMMNAILSLLKNEIHGENSKVGNIVPYDILGVEYSHKSERLSQIVDQRQSFEVFDFITGMNDFIYYGNAEILSDYYERRAIEYPEQKSQTNKITDAMEKISIGTQICSTDLYTEGLDKINDLFKNSNAQGDDLFQIFEKNIKQDYGDILLDPSTAHSIRSYKIVERCFKKKMYQQALTFAESQMPKFFLDEIVKVENGRDTIFYNHCYNNKQGKKIYPYRWKVVNNSHSDFANQLIDTLTFQIESILEWSDNEEKKEKDEEAIIQSESATLQLTEYIFDYMKNNKYNPNKNRPKNNDLNYYEDGYNVFINLRRINYLGTKIAMRTQDMIDEFKINLYDSDNPKIVIWKCTLLSRSSQLDKNKFMELMVLHKVLKNRRNMVNHSLKNNKGDIEELQTLLRRYLDLAGELANVE